MYTDQVWPGTSGQKKSEWRGKGRLTFERQVQAGVAGGSVASMPAVLANENAGHRRAPSLSFFEVRCLLG